MKRLLIVMGLLVGCGDAGGGPVYEGCGSPSARAVCGDILGFDEDDSVTGVERDETVAEAGCSTDEDCDEGFICKPYSGACLPEPRRR